MSRFDFRELFRARTPEERIGALHLRADLARAAIVLVADERIDAHVVRMQPLLEPDETVLLLVEGRHARALGLLMLSTRRVLFRPHGEVMAAPPVVFPLADLSDVHSQTGPMTGRVVLHFADAVLEVDKLLGKLADHFAAAVRTQRAAADEPEIPEVGRRDPLQELAELRSRYAAGDVSSADYEAAKSRLIQEL